MSIMKCQSLFDKSKRAEVKKRLKKGRLGISNWIRFVIIKAECATSIKCNRAESDLNRSLKIVDERKSVFTLLYTVYIRETTTDVHSHILYDSLFMHYIYSIHVSFWFVIGKSTRDSFHFPFIKVIVQYKYMALSQFINLY